MKVILLWTIIRPERKPAVIQRLESEGFFGMTEVSVYGRGRQRGVQVGQAYYDELAKTMLLVAVLQSDCQRAMDVIKSAAQTGLPGDGKIFVQPVREVYTIRTGKREL